MKIWRCGSSPRSGSRNAWTRIKNVKGANRLSNFGIFSARSRWFPVEIGDDGRNLVISLWPGDKATISWVAAKRFTPPQKIPSAKIRWKILASIFLDQESILLIDYLSKGQNINTECYSSLLAQSKDILKEKSRGKVTKGGLVLERQCPGSPVTCNWEETGLPGLNPPYSPDLAPSDYHLFPGLKKTIERSPFFVRRGGYFCCGDLVGRTTFWFFF